MTTARSLVFPPFHFDSTTACLRHGAEHIVLRRKTLAVLRYLVEHPSRLVTTTELLDAVWPGTQVSAGVPRVCIRELRQALGDDPKAPQFIETVRGQGYRFIGPVTETEELGHWSGTLVGREAELTQLYEWLEKALRGQRQTVFVTGEAGIGKTALIEAFLERIAAADKPQIGRGQCVDQYGGGEAYMPVLEALSRLCLAPRGERMTELLGRYAPTWLVQMPWLVSEAELDTLQRKTMGGTRERMVREIAHALDALTVERTLVLVLEDLHWSDPSTLELLSSLARRPERARLLVIGSFRPEGILNRHPLRTVTQELHLHQLCQEIALECLAPEAVEDYLVNRFEGSSPPVGLAKAVHKRTDGSPLFMVNIVDYLLAQGVLTQIDRRQKLTIGVEEVERGMPESLHQIISHQIDGLSAADQQLLEAGSVAGVEFSTATVAAALEVDIVQVEERYARLARGSPLLRTNGSEEWPDGTVAACYNFTHALYQEVLYDRVTAGRRAQLHQRIGEREEVGYGTQTREVAAELAMHFEQGRDYKRAVQYLEQAAQNALQRSAYPEAISHLTRGLELLKTLPDAPERTQQELTLQIALGVPLVATKGYADPEVEQVYTQALTLCQQMDTTFQLCPVLHGLGAFYLVRGELSRARTLFEQYVNLAQQHQDSAALFEAHPALGVALFHLGELRTAHEHFEHGIRCYEHQRRQASALLSIEHVPGVMSLSCASWTLWFLGYPDQALQRGAEALRMAKETAHPFSQAVALANVGLVQLFCRASSATQELAEELIQLTTDQGFPLWRAAGILLRGWALAEQGRTEEGITQIRQGLAAAQDTGATLREPHWLVLLAEEYGKSGQPEAGLSPLAEARVLMEKTGDRFCEAELYRVQAELLLTPMLRDPTAQSHKGNAAAEACFQRALSIARRQGAKSLELRVAMSLSRLWQQQGKKEKAKKGLEEIYGWFTEGFDTADLQEAKMLLTSPGLRRIRHHPTSDR